MAFVTKLQNGYSYLKSWPLRVELNGLFPENRVIYATLLGFRLMPPLAVLSVMLPLLFDRFEYLAQSFFMALFFLALPLQGLAWLDKRANTFLPVSLVSWYREIQDKLAQQGESLPQQGQLRYQDLSLLLSLAYKYLDKSFLRY